MNKGIKIASVLLYIVSALFLLFAVLLVYFIRVKGVLLPPMEKIIGLTTAELNEINPAIFGFMKNPISIVAAFLVALSVGLIIMIKGPFRNQEPWARKTIFSMLGIWLVLADLIAFDMFPYGPWPLWSVCIIITLIAYVVSRPQSTEVE